MSMIDPIDRNALIKKLGIAKDCSGCDHNKTPFCLWGENQAEICESICDAPTVEPEIIRCKDCKFYTAYDYTGKLMCKRIGKGMILPKPEDYCSYAERITDEPDK